MKKLTLLTALLFQTLLVDAQSALLLSWTDTNQPPATAYVVYRGLTASVSETNFVSSQLVSGTSMTVNAAALTKGDNYFVVGASLNSLVINESNAVVIEVSNPVRITKRGAAKLIIQ